MIKRISLAAIISVLLFQQANYSKTLEGLIKFPGKKDSTVFLEVASTDAEKEKGLMNRPDLASNRGMVFVFRPSRTVIFWMKDTLISLDIIFINRGRVVNIAKNTVPNQTETLYPSDKTVTEVVEVNGGFTDNHKIMIGDRIAFENIPQIDYSGMSKLMSVAK
ncbi:MAG: DUF192 domain-containing protein [Candidatus Melainabacteria bacterium]|nr:DUF192 domain-containing protein [Candidatus Melainabacteria bacterium]